MIFKTYFQSAAIVMDPNDFLLHVLNKFSLIRWAMKDYDQMKKTPQDDLIRQTVTLAEEMLTLLIYILSTFLNHSTLVSCGGCNYNY